MVAIRPYTSDDLAALTELMAELGYPTSIGKMVMGFEVTGYRFVKRIPNMSQGV